MQCAPIAIQAPAVMPTGPCRVPTPAPAGHPKLANVRCPIDEVPEKYRLRIPMMQDTYLLNGSMVPWSGAYDNCHSPICTSQNAQGEWVPTVIGKVPSFTERDALAALESCERAWDSGRGLWPTLPVAKRIEAIENFTSMMITRREEVVRLLMWEICKNRSDAEKEFDRTVKYIRDTLDALKETDRASSRFQIEEGIFAQIRRAPLGVCLCMGPFNYPLNETFTTLIPAVLMGNTCIFKPSKLGSLLHGPILECFARCLPPGVVNVVYGRLCVAPIMKTGKVNCLAFIGSSKVSDGIRKDHPTPHRLRCVLGLDAKNPAIVLPCADVDMAVKECVLGSLSFNGQRCTALKLIFVHQIVAARFCQRMVEEVDKLKVGLPWAEGVSLTPMPEADKCKKMRELIDDALSKGAQLINAEQGGGQCTETAMVPAILFGVTPAMRIFHEEQFGPVVPICVYNSVQTPLDFIRDSPYGQQLAIFGTNPTEIAHLVDPLANQVCRINLNSQCQRGPDTFPFTGRKDSAEQTLSVSDALRCFSIRTLLAAKHNPLNIQIVTSILHNRQSTFLSTDFLL
ncbi:NAD(P)-dependent glyceraldehyde-3-phosphate dehydrogenase [Paratrimastix pyriformis]|uniref:Succinate-semialdehyde dehydrogenase, mitochondrial n=1 Tax=Paratrimastix pyriformis TaxID=342808 RepID=A0ABQ8UZC9_9EUKA|nr:NAD(P)-dependent glyceraldehyde-3-phosphate dehydrogenase [Paratrimastix pyriformis]